MKPETSEVHLPSRTSFMSPFRFQMMELSAGCWDYVVTVEEDGSTSSGIRDILQMCLLSLCQ